ncbi:MAG: hypothetical protein K0R44_3557 [Thermomicrobiales bacterium]|nr:hypothetical protein [Thermomicrobiales bacterium]
MRIAGRPCTLLSTAALAVAMTVGLAAAGFAQDATPAAMDDDVGVAYPTHLHSGDCANLSAEPVERLADLLLPEWVAGLTEGDGTEIVAEDFGNAPIPVAAATTEVNIPLADIVAGKHAVNVERPEPDDPEDSVAPEEATGIETALAALAAAEAEAAATPMATPGATPVADADATPVT